MGWGGYGVDASIKKQKNIDARRSGVLHPIQEEYHFHKEDHFVSIEKLYKYNSDNINPFEDIIRPDMFGSKPLTVNDYKQSNTASKNPFDSVDDDIDAVEESEDTLPSIASDINIYMDLYFDKPELQ